MDPLGIGLTDLTGEAYAEQGIDDKTPVGFGGQGIDRLAAARLPFCEGGSSIHWQFCRVTGIHHVHCMEPLFQVPRHHEAVAAIITRTAQNQDGLAAVGNKLPRALCCREARALHQGLVGMTRLDAPNVAG